MHSKLLVREMLRLGPELEDPDPLRPAALSGVVARTEAMAIVRLRERRSLWAVPVDLSVSLEVAATPVKVAKDPDEVVM
jgi:hypothetical protein